MKRNIVNFRHKRLSDSIHLGERMYSLSRAGGVAETCSLHVHDTLGRYVLYLFAVVSSFSIAYVTNKELVFFEIFRKAFAFALIVILFLLREKGFNAKAFILPFLPFLGFSIISALVQGSSLSSLKATCTYMTPIIIGAAFSGRRNTNSLLVDVGRCIILALVISIVGGFITPVFGLRAGIERTWGTGNYVLRGMLFGGQLAEFICLAFLLNITKPSNFTPNRCLLIVLLFLLLVFTGGRTALFAVIVVSIPLFWAIIKKVRKSTAFLLLVSLVVLVYIGGMRTIEKSVLDEEGEDVAIYTSRRAKLWPIYFELAMSRPIFGCGPDAIISQMRELPTADSYSPHNSYLSLLTTSGLAGLVTYLLGWGVVLQRTVKENIGTNRSYVQTVIACSTCLAICAVAGNTFTNLFTMSFLACVVGSGITKH